MCVRQRVCYHPWYFFGNIENSSFKRIQFATQSLWWRIQERRKNIFGISANVWMKIVVFIKKKTEYNVILKKLRSEAFFVIHSVCTACLNNVPTDSNDIYTASLIDHRPIRKDIFFAINREIQDFNNVKSMVKRILQ